MTYSQRMRELNALRESSAKVAFPVFGRCTSCHVALLELGGFHGTNLCGPCCTGEARTAGMLSKDDLRDDE